MNMYSQLQTKRGLSNIKQIVLEFISYLQNLFPPNSVAVIVVWFG